ncbi:MAG: tRNA (N(6)-L-threonylcarbamoyladenosine(37)-C(2))-methylthiotransferase MtaB [Deltaproteobacteria bacterium]|nr:tRNA (N(6)-L-threonylcarbamoyladenosine(37)-C(2))-methylthiotransferase MtaB [Deltaproteobacteria bacterium]
MKVSICTFGCRSNQYDSTAIEELLKHHNLETAGFPEHADAYIINTCTVTAKTDAESRRLVRKARSINPDAVIVLTGCYAQVSPDEAASMNDVDYVLGNPEKERVVEFILKGLSIPEGRRNAQIHVGNYLNGVPFTLRTTEPIGRARVNLKVQDGCNRNCSFCIIPKARGISRSVPLSMVLKEIEGIVLQGFKEIVLTGIHLGGWGHDLSPKKNIIDLFYEIERRGFPARFRVSSLDPDEVTDELISLLARAKTICNHLHLPIQSGDDTILERMRRPYTARHLEDIVSSLNKNIEDISIGADVIAGFPGEGEREFENTFSLIKKLPLNYLHIFPYSKRKGTPAADMTGHVQSSIIKKRAGDLKKLDTQKRREFYGSFLGKRLSIVIESTRDERTGLLKGKSKNYIPVTLDGGDSLLGTLQDVLVKQTGAEAVTGML